MRIAIFGRTKMLMNSIELFEKSEHEIVLIGTCNAQIEYGIYEEDFRKKAEILAVPFFCTQNINKTEIVNIISGVEADIAISVNWISIIGRTVIELFRFGILNAHCGDLPRYRGNAGPNWAILNGEAYMGISIHKMEPDKLDSGDIIVKKLYPLSNTTTVTEIYAYIESMVPNLFNQAIKKILNGEQGEKQSSEREKVLRAYPRVPSDSWINWNEHCESIGRLIRASTEPFSGAYTYLDELCIKILDFRIEDFEYPSCYIPGQVVWINRKMEEVGVAAKDGIVVITKIKVDGYEENVCNIIHSTRMRLNYHVQDSIYQLQTRIENIERVLHLTI